MNLWLPIGLDCRVGAAKSSQPHDHNLMYCILINSRFYNVQN